MSNLFRTKQEIFNESIEEKRKELHDLNLDNLSEELEIDEDWFERNVINNSWEIEEMLPDENYIRV